MPLHKVTKPFNTDGRMDARYYGLHWVEKDGVIYADVPQEFVDDYIAAGRIYPLDAEGNAPAKKEDAPVVEEEVVDPVVEAAESTDSAKEVVEGTTQKAVEKKTSRRNKGK